LVSPFVRSVASLAGAGRGSLACSFPAASTRGPGALTIARAGSFAAADGRPSAGVAGRE
jgi:hypothetical protein